MGGGHQGLAMTAHLSYNGESITLWNRSVQNVALVKQSGMIHAHGIIEANINAFDVCTNLEDVDTDLIDLIMITTTANAHRDIARLLAPHLREKTTVVLNPGRTFGALEFAAELKKAGCVRIPRIAETQTIVYTCRRDSNNSVTIFALKDNVPIAAVRPEDLPAIIDVLPPCLRPHFLPVNSTVATSLGNVGMILHCAPVLMNIGWIESTTAEFKYYYNGISPSIAHFLEKMDQERIAVALAMGWEIPYVMEWLKQVYHVEGETLYECLQNNESYQNIDAPLALNHRYIADDVPYGLVPLEAAAKHYRVPVPCTTLIIDLANAVMGTNYRAIGRGYIPITNGWQP